MSRFGRPTVLTLMHRASFFVAVVAASIPAFAAAGCNAKTEVVLSSDAEPIHPAPNDGSSSTFDGGSTPKTCPGACLPQGEPAPPNRRPAGSDEGTCPGTDVCWVLVGETVPDVPCTTDPDCNPSPEISSLHGRCFHGVCVCNFGYVQPNGKCGPDAPPDCTAHDGTCKQDPAACPTGSLEGETETNTSCGDFVAAVCCMDASKCKGPSVDMVCCGASTTPSPPVCVNGWKTCPKGKPTPALASEGCK